MGRVNSYTNVTRPSESDELLIDGSAGTRNVTMKNAAIEMAGMVSAIQHRNIWRGKSLGSSFTDAQKTAISNGSFDDLFIGDYWTMDGVVYRIIDMDYWYGQGDTSCTKHHIVIMPDKQLYQHVMNDESTTVGGYMLSKMRTEGLEEAKATINSAFGAENVLNHRAYFINAVTDGHGSAGGWADSTVEIPNEIMMYGCHIRAAMNTGDPLASLHTLDKTQLAAMRINPLMINPSRQTQWLRDVVSATTFAYIGTVGVALNYSASNTAGVRPVAGITGGN